MAKQNSPSWPDVIQLVETQGNLFREEVTGLRADLREWREELKRTSDEEHKAIIKASEKADANTNLRINWVLAVIAPIGLGAVGLFFWLLQQHLLVIP